MVQPQVGQDGQDMKPMKPMSPLQYPNWNGWCGLLNEVMLNKCPPMCFHSWEPKPSVKRGPDGGGGASPVMSTLCQHIGGCNPKSEAPLAQESLGMMFGQVDTDLAN